MSVLLELEPDVEAALEKKAAATGSPVNTYVKKLIETHIDLGPTYEEVMAPLWNDFEESGMTELELDSFVDDLREKVWQEKNKG
jgi:hypothetical protein